MAKPKPLPKGDTARFTPTGQEIEIKKKSNGQRPTQ